MLELLDVDNTSVLELLEVLEILDVCCSVLELLSELELLEVCCSVLVELGLVLEEEELLLISVELEELDELLLELE